jgi:uncharacterized membrane protein YkvA (DUF1232 family)
MNLNDFRNSRWVKGASNPVARTEVMQQLPRWSAKVQNRSVVEKAGALWDYLISGKFSKGDIVFIVAALLYLISPFDAVPDYIPVIGWLDDLTVASLVLTYLDHKAAGGQI